MSIVFRTVLFTITMEFVLLQGSNAVVNATTKKTDAIPDKGWLEARMLSTLRNGTRRIWLQTNQRGREISSTSYNNIQDSFSSAKASKKFYSPGKEQEMISALSKIAKVRLASREQNDDTPKSIFKTIFKKSGNSQMIQGSNDDSDSSSNLKKSQKYHCRAIRDVFIPEIQEMMPAYHCKSENKSFILSSVRFLQDRRSYLDVDINEDTVQKLPIQKNPESNSTSVLPATLILRLGDDAYKIRASQNKTSEKLKHN